MPYEPLKIGDLVDFSTKKHEHGFSNIKITKGPKSRTIQSGGINQVPPTMVVTEIYDPRHQSTSRFDETTGKNKASSIKIYCTWFSASRCKFENRQFDIRVLEKVMDLPQIAPSFEVGEIVTLRTALHGNSKLTKLIEHEIAIGTTKTKYQIEHKYDTTAFYPPKMVIVGLEEKSIQDEKKKIFSSLNGKKVREIPTMFAKCMWFDYQNGKYSEPTFPLEILMKISDLEDFDLSSLVELK